MTKGRGLLEWELLMPPGPKVQHPGEEPPQTHEEQARAFLASVDEMVYFQGLDGSLKMLNDANTRITGYSLEEFEANPQLWREIVHPDDRKVAEDFFARYPDGTASFEVQYRLTTKGGEERWIQSRLVGVKDLSGRYIGYNCIDRDITEQKRIERELADHRDDLQRLVQELAAANQVAEQANQDIRRFVSLLSHDLRGPLLNVQCFLGEVRTTFEAVRGDLEPWLARMDDETRHRIAAALEEEVPAALEFAESSARRIDALSSAVLEVSSAGDRILQWEPVDLDDVVRDIVEGLGPLVESTGARVEVGPLPQVVSDRFSVQRIFDNLLSNALQYLQPGRPGKVTVIAETHPREIHIRVEDNGRGMARQDIPKAFAPFRRLDSQTPGTGMGLTYVRVLVDQLQGRIACTSSPGKGTVFTLVLPRQPQEPTPTTDPL